VRLAFTPNGWQDYTHWLAADGAALKRIDRLIDDVLRDPFEGTGKPESRCHALTGARSRRHQPRAQAGLYLADDDDIVILQARYHHTRTSSPRSGM